MTETQGFNEPQTDKDMWLANIQWWHCVRLPMWQRQVRTVDGKTPGWLDCENVVKNYILDPEDIKGKTVLDIGAWDGGYSFIAEDWGASDVLATDSWAWEHIGKDGIELCIEMRQSKIRTQFCKTYEISPETVGMFDVVFFLGVIYHLRNPLISTDRAISVVKPGGMMCVETAIDEIHNNTGRPQMTYFPHNDPFYNDGSNWWFPNNLMMHVLLQPYFDKVSHTNWSRGGLMRGFFRCEGRNDRQPSFKYY